MSGIMMKIWLLSDTHFEMGNPQIIIPAEEVDVIVFAGDIHMYHQVFAKIYDILDDYMNVHSNIPDVVYVPGNHEYYDNDIDYVNNYLKQTFDEFSTFHYLRLSKPAVTIRGVDFVGDILWGDGGDHNPVAEYDIKSRVADFRYITNGGDKFTPEVMNRLNKNGRKSIINALSKSKSDKTVVVSHYLPSYECVSERFVGSFVNGAFASEQSNVMDAYNPNVWLFGHTHDQVDTQIFNTRCIAEPCGLGRREYHGKIIEV